LGFKRCCGNFRKTIEDKFPIERLQSMIDKHYEETNHFVPAWASCHFDGHRSRMETDDKGESEQIVLNDANSRRVYKVMKG